MQFWVYILANRRNGTLYVGVTRDLVRRVWEHKSDIVDGFTSRYGVHILVWHELTPYLQAAIAREKQIKAWKRLWEVELVERINPDWNDLFKDLI